MVVIKSFIDNNLFPYLESRTIVHSFFPSIEVESNVKIKNEEALPIPSAPVEDVKETRSFIKKIFKSGKKNNMYPILPPSYDEVIF